VPHEWLPQLVSYTAGGLLYCEPSAMKGIVLAGGSGTRLSPMTRAVCKQLLPVYDKPMIYYPLSVLMLAGIREVLLIANPADLPLFERLLGNGAELGMHFAFAEQAAPNGLADALLIGETFLGGQPCGLVLGDNLFYGAGLSTLLKQSVKALTGCTLFGHRVDDPQRYGVVELGPQGEILSLEEKPERPRSHMAVTGLYFYDGDASAIARTLRPSPRGELEITDLNRVYVERGQARVEVLGRGVAWLDTGTPSSLLEASQFVHALQTRQGMQIACLEEVAFRERFISAEQLARLSALHANSSYGNYLASILRGE